MAIERDTPLELKIETEQESDGRWIAEITNFPGVMCYGNTRDEAVASAQALALRVLADQIEQEKSAKKLITIACA